MDADFNEERKPSTPSDQKCTPEKDYSRLAPALSQSAQTPETNVPWLRYLRAYDLSTALVVMEEWFRTMQTTEQEKYEQLVPAVFEANLDRYVSDILADPSSTRPFSCLVIALFARVWLSLYLYTRQESVTWEDVLGYVPSLLKARLDKRAKAYLEKHPVLNCKGASMTKVGVVEHVAIKNMQAVQPSRISSELQTTKSSSEDPEACRKPSPDMPDVTNESSKQQIPEADERPCQSTKVHGSISKTSGSNVAAGLNEQPGAEKNEDEIESLPATNDPEARNRASSAPCGDDVSTENAPNREVRSASTSKSSTREQNPDSNQELSQCAYIERIVSEKLGLDLYNLRRKPGADMEMIDVSQDPAVHTGTKDTTRHDVLTENNGTLQEACHSLPSSFKYRERSLDSSEGGVPQLGGLRNEEQVDGKCAPVGKVKYEKIFGENAEDCIALPESSSADPPDQLVSDQEPNFTESLSKPAGADEVPYSNSFQGATFCHELKTQSSRSELPEAESNPSASLTSVTSSDEVRLKLLGKVLPGAQKEQHNLMFALFACRRHNRANCHAPSSNRGSHEMSGVMSQEPRSRIQQYDTGGLAPHSRLQARKREDADPTSCLQQVDYGNRSKTPDLFRNPVHFDSSRTVERSSQSARLNSQFEQGEQEARHQPSEPSESMCAKRVEEVNGKELPLPFDDESVEPVTEGQEFAERSEKTVSCLPSPKASSDVSREFSGTLKLQGHSVPKHPNTRQLRDSIVNAAKYPSSSCGEGERATQSAGIQDSLAEEPCDRRSRSRGCVQSATHQTQRDAAQAGTVETPEPEVKIAQAKTSFGATLMPRAPFAEGISAHESSRAPASSLQRSRIPGGRFQSDFACALKVGDESVHCNAASIESRTLDALYTTNSESVRLAPQACCRHQERPAEEENLSPSG